MKTTIARAVPALVLLGLSGCGGPSNEEPGALKPHSAAGLGAAVSNIDEAAPSAGEGSRIPLGAKSRAAFQTDRSDRRVGQSEAAKALNSTVDAIAGRAARSTALLEVAVGEGPTGIRRTGVAFCVDSSGTFITHADVVKGVTEPTGQVRMILGGGLEDRWVRFPRILRVDDETGLASLQVPADPGLRLEPMAPARSGEVSPDSVVVLFGFPRGVYMPLNRDAQGKAVPASKFHFNYGAPWDMEPPGHLLTTARVGKVALEGGRPRAFELHERVEGSGDLTVRRGSSGAPALDASGEVVGVVTMPENMGLFVGMVSVEQLSKFLGRAPAAGLAATPARDDRFDVIRKGKKATAMVEVSTRRGECTGTAFCVDRSGLFITNAHVVEDATTGAREAVSLVMDVGLPTQRTATAQIVRIDPEVDLALLKIDADPHLEALDLGRDDDVLPTLRIVAFGFPFGRRVASAAAEDRTSYPDVAVNANRLTAIDRDNVSRAIAELRFDGQLNPGNSGGPVVDPNGKVVGVAVATILGASINFAIPVGRLREFLAVPGVEVRSQPVAFEDRARPTTWTIRVVPSPFARLPEDLSVAVAIADGTHAPRKLRVQPGGAGTFTVEFVPRPRDPGRGVALALRLGDRPEDLPVVVEDQEVTIGGEALRLGALRHVAVRPKSWALLPDERLVKGPIAGLGKVAARTGNQIKTIDLAAANEFTVLALEPEKHPVIDATIVVRKGGPDGAILCESRNRVEFTDVPATAPPPVATSPTPVPPETEKRLTLITRTLPESARNARDRLPDIQGPSGKGGELYVTGVPRGAVKAIRPARVVVGEALMAEASGAGLGTRTFDFPRPGVNTARAIEGAAFSQDGSRLALGLPGSIRVIDVASGKLIREVNQPRASLLAFSANGAKLVAYSPVYFDNGRLNASRSGPLVEPARGPVEWDLKTGTTTSPAPMPDIARVPLQWIAPGGRFIAVNTGVVQCRDLRTGKASLVIQDDQLIGFPRPTPDGKRLLSFYAKPSGPSSPAAAASKNVRGRGQAPAPMPQKSADRLRVHELETGRLLFETVIAGMTLVGLVPGTDTGVFEAEGGVMVVRDLRAGKELRRVALRPDPAPATASPRARPLRSDDRKPQLTPDGKRLVKPAPDGGFVVFDLATGAEVARQATIASIETAVGNELILPTSGRTALILVWRDCCLWTLPDAPSLSTSVAARKPEPPTVRELGGTATAVAVGGAGRYLLLTLAQARQLAVFDANAADVVKTIPLSSENAMVAAGASQFVIADPDAKRIERWDLGSFARDGEPQPLPFDGTLQALALGADSDGPMLANWSTAKTNQGPGQNRFSFIDLATLRIQAVGVIAFHGMNDRTAKLAASGGAFTLWGENRNDLKPRIRASHDGSLFGVTWTGNAVQNVEVGVKAEAGVLTVSHDSTERWRAAQPYLIPSPDGRRFVHGKTGIRDAVFYQTPARDSIGRSSEKSTVTRLPSADPRYDISVRTAESITILRAEDGSGVATVSGLDEMTGVLQDDDIVRDGISLDHRYHLVPAAKLLVTIPPTNDRLVLRRLDLDPAPGRTKANR